jgi:hypothetical protein
MILPWGAHCCQWQLFDEDVGTRLSVASPLSSLGLPETAEAMIYGAMSRLMLRRLAQAA